jgi:hypothetical protein
VNNRDRGFPATPSGRRVRAVLDPALGEGGPEGWCPGTFKSTITYSRAFACPATRACHPPPSFPQRPRVVSRFSFRVR